MLVNLADTKENREHFGTTGTGDGSSPFPQLRIVALTARAGRAILGAVTGTASDGEQTLLKILASEQPGLFAHRVTLFDRNFPGYDLITAILLAGGHVVARVKGGITLPFQDTPDKGWLPDGSRASWLNAPSGKKDGPAPGPGRRALGPRDWPGRGTGLGDLHPGHHPPGLPGRARPPLSARPIPPGGARRRPPSARTRPPSPEPGNRTSGPVLRSGCPRLVLQEAWAWLAGTQLIRAGEAATLRSEEAAARVLRRTDKQPVTADEESFTAAWHHAVRSMETTQVTATSSLAAIAAAAGSAARAHLHVLNVPGRDRHSPREAESTPEIPAHVRDQSTPSPENTRSSSTRPAAAELSAPPLRPGRTNCPAPCGAAACGTARQTAATRGPCPCPHATAKRTLKNTRNTRTVTLRQD